LIRSTVFAFAHRLGGASMRDNDRRRRKHEIPVRMIVVGSVWMTKRAGWAESFLRIAIAARASTGSGRCRHHHSFLRLDKADVESCAFAA